MDTSALLSEASSTETSLPSSTVTTMEPTLVDLGNLLLTTSTPLDRSEAALARDGAQLLVNALFKLPRERVEGESVAVLPLPSSQMALPREKPLPKPRPPTKWELYAKEKGIEKKKKSRLVWDDVVKQWKPRFGYKRNQVEDAKNWMMEIKDTADPYEDPFEKAKQAKKERVAKNEYQRLKNLARAKKIKPGMGVMSAPTSNVNELKKAAALAHVSTASLGKFQPDLPNNLNKKVGKSASLVRGKKRKFEPLISSDERDRNLRVLQTLHSKVAKMDVNKAAGHHIYEEEQERSSEKKSGSSNNDKKKMGKGKKKLMGSAKKRKHGNPYGQNKKGKGGGKVKGNNKMKKGKVGGGKKK